MPYEIVIARRSYPGASRFLLIHDRAFLGQPRSRPGSDPLIFEARKPARPKAEGRGHAAAFRDIHAVAYETSTRPFCRWRMTSLRAFRPDGIMRAGTGS